MLSLYTIYHTKIKRKENDQFFTKQGQEAGLKLYGENTKPKDGMLGSYLKLIFNTRKSFIE